jgi:hypothetical protein
MLTVLSMEAPPTRSNSIRARSGDLQTWHALLRVSLGFIDFAFIELTAAGVEYIADERCSVSVSTPAASVRGLANMKTIHRQHPIFLVSQCCTGLRE